MRRIPLPIRWLLPSAAILAFIACVPPPPTGGGLSEDLQQLQGVWEARWAGRVVRREVVGAREAVSYYGADGTLERSHTADIDALRTADGRQLVFRWYNLRSTTGAAQNPGQASGEYLYQLEGAKLTELHGATPERPESKDVIVWTRLSGPPLPAPEPGP